MKEFYAGNFRQQYGYKSFLPESINCNIDIKDRGIPLLLERAVRYLGELNAFSQLVPNIDVFIKMHAAKEAALSSQIEGTRTQIDEAVTPEEEIIPERRDDWHEVNNYIRAMEFSIEKLKEVPLSMRLLKETHAVLLSGVRGEQKSPGEIRRSQNWIGGSTLSDAFFIPPHFDDLGDLLADLQSFWHNDNLELPFLVKVALSHYQFETIHPFLDGNGRLGRLLIVLHLVEQGYLKYPTLYLSDFFVRNKGAYYDSLTQVRASHNIDQWIKFFLNGIIETAQQGSRVLSAVVELRKSYEGKIATLNFRGGLANRALEYLFKNPIVSINRLSNALESNFPTVSKLVDRLVLLGILKEKTNYSRNRLFVMDEYVGLYAMSIISSRES